MTFIDSGGRVSSHVHLLPLPPLAITNNEEDHITNKEGRSNTQALEQEEYEKRVLYVQEHNDRIINANQLLMTIPSLKKAQIDFDQCKFQTFTCL